MCVPNSNSILSVAHLCCVVFFFGQLRVSGMARQSGGNTKRLQSKEEVLRAQGAWIDQQTLSAAISSTDPQPVLRADEQMGPAVVCKCYRFEYNQDQGMSKQGGCAVDVPGLKEHEKTDEEEPPQPSPPPPLQVEGAMEIDEEDPATKIARLATEITQGEENLKRLHEAFVQEFPDGEEDLWDLDQMQQLTAKTEDTKRSLEQMRAERKAAVDELDRRAEEARIAQEEAQRAQEEAQKAARLAEKRAQDEAHLEAKMNELKVLAPIVRNQQPTNSEEKQQAVERFKTLQAEVKKLKALLGL